MTHHIVQNNCPCHFQVTYCDTERGQLKVISSLEGGGGQGAFTLYNPASTSPDSNGTGIILFGTYLQCKKRPSWPNC